MLNSRLHHFWSKLGRLGGSDIFIRGSRSSHPKLFSNIIHGGAANEENDYIKQYGDTNEVNPYVFFHYEDLMALQHLSLAEFCNHHLGPTPYASRHACSRSDAEKGEGLRFLIVIVVDSAIGQRLLQLGNAWLCYFGMIQKKRG